MLYRAEVRPVGAYYTKAGFSSTSIEDFNNSRGSANECPQEIIRVLSIDGVEADARCPSVKDAVARMAAPCGRVTP